MMLPRLPDSNGLVSLSIAFWCIVLLYLNSPALGF